MRVLINGRFLTQRVTGVQRYARRLVEFLAARSGDGVELVLAAPRDGLLSPFPPIKMMRDGSSLNGHAWEQVRLPFLFRKSRANLLWSPCNTGPVAVSRQVVTIHDAAVFAGPSWFSPAFGAAYRVLHKVLGRRCRRILTDSAFSRTELARFGVAPESKTRVVPAGVSVPSGAPKGVRPVGAYVLALGSRDPRKDVKTLLRAWALFPEELKAGRSLLVAGGGGASFAEESLGSVPAGVRFLGYVPDGELPDLYAGAEVFISCSVYEGFGLTPLESMAAGTPVLVSDIPPHREVCGDAAAYFEPRDAEMLAAELTAFYHNPDRRAEMADAGRRRAAMFTWDAAADQLLRALKEVA